MLLCLWRRRSDGSRSDRCGGRRRGHLRQVAAVTAATAMGSNGFMMRAFSLLGQWSRRRRFRHAESRGSPARGYGGARVRGGNRVVMVVVMAMLACGGRWGGSTIGRARHGARGGHCGHRRAGRFNEERQRRSGGNVWRTSMAEDITNQ